MTQIYYHADDFGITKEQTDTILNCAVNGALNSVSVMPNSVYLSEALSILEQDSFKHIRKVVHLNFIEGKSVSDPQKLPLLTDENGNFKCSFGYLLKLNYGNKHTRSELKKELKQEILAQIQAVFPNDKTINLDAHQHFHMIPVVFEAIEEVFEENHYTMKMLRIPVDPVFPVFSTPGMFFKVRLVDYIKWILLGFYAKRIKKRKLARHCEIPLFFGISFTCRMTKEHVLPLIEKYKSIADKQKCSLELMFHPGAISQSTDLLDASNNQLVQFYNSVYRDKEAECLLFLGGKNEK